MLGYIGIFVILLLLSAVAKIISLVIFKLKRRELNE